MGNSLDAAKLVATARAEERCGEEWVVIETAATLEAPKLGERESSGCSSPQSDQDLLNLSFDSGYEEPEQNAALEQPASNPGLQSKQSDPDYQPCRTDACLGQHHSYYDIRLFQYDEDSEGNTHITDEDL